MKLQSLSLGLAVAISSTLALAAPVDYKIDPTHTATVFSEPFWFFNTKCELQ